MMRILALIIIFLTFISACGTDKIFTKNDSVAEVSKKNPDVDLEGGKEIVLSEFILGVGDEVEITVYRHDDLNKKIRIPPEGKNTLPLIGEIQTKGVSIHQLVKKIKKVTMFI